MTEQWMQDNTVSDVQTAIQSQIIQTALEKNTSDLTPQALQSFLTQAPIPRFYVNSFNTSFPAGTTTCIYGTGGLHDPMGMLNVSTGIVTIPIDGYYHFHWTMFGSAPAGTSGVYFIDITDANPPVNRYGSSLVDCEAGVSIVIHVDALKPFRAGSKVLVTNSNNNITTITPTTGSFSGTWVAPYDNYQGGQN